MSTVLKNGIIIPENGSRNWGGDLANNWNIIDVNIGYMTDVKNKVTTLENSVAENTANISALQTSKQDVIEDLETIRSGASSGATAVQPSALSDYYTKAEVDTALTSKANDSDVVHKSDNEVISGIKSFSSDVRISKASPFLNAFASGYVKGQAPSANLYAGVRFFDEPNSGSANSITGGFEIEYNRDGYNKSYISSRNYAGETHKFCTVGLRVPNDDVRSVDFLPSVNGIVNLGTSTNKWKTLNGINPGALSLPNPSPSVFIGKALPSSGGIITADVDGWLEIRAKATSSNALIQLFVAGGSSTYAKNTGDDLIISVPVSAGVSVTIFYRDIEAPSVCRLVPCIGNV